LVRLLVLGPPDGGYQLLGLQEEEIAACRFAALGAPGGGLWVADDGCRLVGLVKVTPRPRASLVLGASIWCIDQFTLAQDAPAGTLDVLLIDALSGLSQQVDLVQVQVTTPELRLLRDLPLAGFVADSGSVLAAWCCDGGPLRSTGASPLSLLRHPHLERAVALATEADPVGEFSSEPRFERRRLAALHAQKILAHISDPLAEALVAEGPDGQIEGLIGYRRLPQVEEFASVRVALVDLVCLARFGQHQNDTLDRLLDGLARRLREFNFAGALVELSVTGPEGVKPLKRFVEAGYAVASSSQTHRLWLQASVAPDARPASAAKVHLVDSMGPLHAAALSFRDMP
jgi:hypothetical protein